jgi:elongation factor 3
MVPLLVRALNDRSAEVLRSTCIISDNLFKLVRNPLDAGQFLDQLLPGLNRIIETAAYPEVRKLAAQAKATLVKSALNEKERRPSFAINGKETESPTEDVDNYIKGLKIEAFKKFECSRLIVEDIISSLIKKELYEKSQWVSVLTPYMAFIMLPAEIEKFVSNIYTRYNDIYEVHYY